MKHNISEVIRLCDIGYAAYSAAYYADIAALLSQEEQTDAIVKALRLASVGPTLSSPRFAYPHIKSALLDDA